MDIDQLVEQIMEAAYHSEIFHEDPVVQERIVKSNVTNLLQDFIDEVYYEFWRSDDE
jgi:hypothetical protein